MHPFLSFLLFLHPESSNCSFGKKRKRDDGLKEFSFSACCSSILFLKSIRGYFLRKRGLDTKASNMAENLGLFRCPLPIFIFFLFHGSVLSVVNGDLWKIHCISLKDHSVCEKKMFLLLVQMVSVCRKTELLEFKNWSFMERSILLKEFDVDEETRNYIRQVHGVIFSKVHLVPLKYKPYLVAISQEVLTDILDLNDSAFESPAFIDFAAGNEMIPNSIMLSHRYGGHQFGDWAGQLGDGRAVILGEYTNRIGERWELQLKGSGKTPYSRHGDGRAVLRSSVREFLASEAMFHLGVPTSRAASLIVSNDLVWRDQFYDGHPKQEKVAIVLRLAKSWFRIGSLEILEHNSEEALLRKVVDFVIENNFQDLVNKTKKYLAFFSRVVSMTADLISKWQSVGFAHGVCNTDNFSLLSITIDYGPFGFMDDFNPDFVPNTSDDEGRYSYKNQPNVGFFNLEKLLQALKPLIEDYSEGEKVLWSYVDRFNQRFLSIFRRKLGLLYEDENDEMLIHSFLWIMSSTHADFTMAFRELSEVSLHDVNSNRLPRETWALKQLQTHKNWGDWLAHYVDRSRLYSDTNVDKARRKQMQEVNPRYVLRNCQWQNQRYRRRKGMIFQRFVSCLRYSSYLLQNRRLLRTLDTRPNLRNGPLTSASAVLHRTYFTKTDGVLKNLEVLSVCWVEDDTWRSSSMNIC